MDVQAAMGDGRMLRRVMALLVSFAVLAERAALRSAPVRFFVLWLSRRAETAAEAFVFEQAGTPPLAVDGIAAVGNGTEDALRLAARFRALAAALGALLPSGWRLACRPGFWSGQGHLVAAGSNRRPGGWTPRPHDTS